MRRDPKLFLVTLGALILGIDYTWNLIPGLPAFFTLNRFLFLAVLAADILFYSEKYLRAGRIYLAAGLILIGSLPYLAFGAGSLEASLLGPGLKLLGSFSFLLFFYVNCRDAETAGRISTVLMLTSGVIVLYVLGSEIGMFGGRINRWRGAVEFTSAAGIFDPNVITLNYLPVFAFAPFLRLRRRDRAGRPTDLAAAIYVGFCLVTFFFLNTRAGSLAVAAALAVAFLLRFLIISPGDRGGRLSVILFSAGLAGALVYANIQYDLLGPIIGIWGETALASDTSFSIRLASYRYLTADLLSAPSLFGFGYQDWWREMGTEPHNFFLDYYLQGGLLFLVTYLCLFLCALTAGFRGALGGRDPVEKACFAGFFAFLIGLIPLMITLSIGGYKSPWAVLGCVLGLSAARTARKKKISDKMPAGDLSVDSGESISGVK